MGTANYFRSRFAFTVLLSAFEPLRKAEAADGRLKILKKLLHSTFRLLEFASAFKRKRFSLTINRQLFFLWLDNAFAFG